MLSGRWSTFNVDPMEAFRLPLVGGSGRGRGRVLGLVLGDNEGGCEALEANYRPPGEPVGGGLLLNGNRGRGRELSPIGKGESYESKMSKTRDR